MAPGRASVKHRRYLLTAALCMEVALETGGPVVAMMSQEGRGDRGADPPASFLKVTRGLTLEGGLGLVVYIGW